LSFGGTLWGRRGEGKGDKPKTKTLPQKVVGANPKLEPGVQNKRTPPREGFKWLMCGGEEQRVNPTKVPHPTKPTGGESRGRVKTKIPPQGQRSCGGGVCHGYNAYSLPRKPNGKVGPEGGTPKGGVFCEPKLKPPQPGGGGKRAPRTRPGQGGGPKGLVG